MIIVIIYFNTILVRQGLLAFQLRWASRWMPSSNVRAPVRHCELAAMQVRRRTTQLLDHLHLQILPVASLSTPILHLFPGCRILMFFCSCYVDHLPTFSLACCSWQTAAAHKSSCRALIFLPRVCLPEFLRWQSLSIRRPFFFFFRFPTRQAPSAARSSILRRRRKGRGGSERRELP